MPPIQENAEPIPGYRLISRLGRGGCGEVWTAEAPGGILKAIKFVQGDLDGFDPGAAAQEQKSLHRVKAIRHPFVLSIERFDVIDGQLIIVMELADKNLYDRHAECAANGRAGIPREELLRYMEEAAEALDLMSTQHQLQHLDIKPQNIFLVHQHVKVADFGLAKDFQGTRAALTGGMTPMYAAPETFDGWVSRQTDQYSLAIVYMEMLTGRRPFGGANTRQLIMQHLSAPPDLAALAAGDRPAVARALAKTPDERFLSCADFVRSLRLVGVHTASPPAGPAPADRKTDPFVKVGCPPVVPAAKVNAPPARSNRPPVTRTGFQPRPTRPDRGGERVLFPALVIGIGGTGVAALRHLRGLVQDRFGRPTVPNLRWLYIDTDAACVAAAGAGDPATSLASHEVVLAPSRLPTECGDLPDFPPVDTRLTAETLGKLPAVPATHGVRGLGRLALADHFPAVRDRLQAVLAEFATPAPLAEAERATGLGARSGSPRVYVVASAAGGTGSGMLIDVAFLARRLLRDLKLSAEHVVGLVAVPFPDAGSALPGNALRALEELRHHDRPDTAHEVRLGPDDRPVADTGRPFRRCALIDHAAAPAVTAAHLLFADAFTPVGQALYPDRSPAPETPYSVANVRRLLWPRDRLLAAVAGRLARDTLAGWTGPADAGMTETVARAIDREWVERRLDVELVRTGIEFGSSQKLTGSIDALVQEIVPSSPAGSPAGPDVYAAGAAVDRLIELLGVPGADDAVVGGRAGAALAAHAAEFGAAADARLVSLVVSLVEKPGLRVSAAQEAVRRLGERLAGSLATVERESAGLDAEARAGLAGLRDLLAIPVGTGKSMTRKPNVPSDFSTRAAQWAKTRFRQLRDRAAADVYRKLLATIPQLDRELGLVTNGLTDLIRELSAPTDAVPPADEACEYLLPLGAQSFDEAVDRLVDGFGEGTRREFDDLVQSKLRKAGRGIIQVAVRPEDSGPRLVRVLRAEAERFVGERANRLSATQALVKQYPDRGELQDFLGRVFDRAAPAVAAGGTRRTVVGLANDLAGQQVGDLLRKVASDGQVLEALVDDEVLVHREWHNVPLAGLLGRPAEAGRLSHAGSPPRVPDDPVMI